MTRLDPVPTVRPIEPNQTVEETQRVRVTVDARQGFSMLAEHVTPVMKTHWEP